MQPIELLLFLVPLWLLSHLWLLPLFRQRWKSGDLNSQIKRAGSLTILEKIRDLSAIGCIVILGLMALVQRSSFSVWYSWLMSPCKDRFSQAIDLGRLGIDVNDRLGHLLANLLRF